ncbi:protein NO VEIN domain-containing protein [Pyxidicoccus xibeiensis]|uniref:protein NO VEIN domain-containing protein n=1 Tax=Pyxidicoccus xibeiensis TaxID=2906759 RepID=UPI0020A6FC14|nr:DUF3883 domain-containing protein [Pyxidicoccus xibeiensis]MCP3136920.1 DUF3883 domain-containing protein [Pyxidicoccus xibeiensis]
MKIAIKPLTASDLSFFKSHAERAGQKAIALDGGVFVDDFYPGLRKSFERVIVSLVVVGPGGRTAHRLTRRVQRSPGPNGWCLGGELICDSDDESGRFDSLAVGDYGVLAFEGAGRPAVVTLVLVSAHDDSQLHEAIATRSIFAERNTLVAVSDSLVAELRAVTEGAYPGEHPLEVLGLRDTIEDVLFGNTSPVLTSRRPSGRSMRMSHEDLRRRILDAEETSQRGEDLFGMWLVATGHGEDDFDWVAQTHVRSAFDYEVRAARWVDGVPHVFVDVKTTRGPCERPLHMSIGELRFAASVDNYRIARVYELGGSPTKLRILSGVKVVAERIIAGLDSLPAGATADSIQIDPGMFDTELEAALA